MLEIIYLPTNEVGLFIPKQEYFLILLMGVFCVGMILGAIILKLQERSKNG